MGEIFRKHEQEPVPPIPPALGVPEWLESVMRRALEKDPSARFSSAGEMQEALEQEVLVETPTAVIPTAGSETPTALSWIIRMPRWAMGLAALGLLAVVLGVVALVGPSITGRSTGPARSFHW
jgi:negative regulator of sigma E activity